MILSQVSSSTEATGVWAAATFLASSFVVSIGKLLSDWRTNRNQEKILESIDKSNRDAANHLMDLTVKLEKQEAVRDEQHKNNIRTMTDLCKAPYFCKHVTIHEPQKPV